MSKSHEEESQTKISDAMDVPFKNVAYYQSAGRLNKPLENINLKQLKNSTDPAVKNLVDAITLIRLSAKGLSKLTSEERKQVTSLAQQLGKQTFNDIYTKALKSSFENKGKSKEKSIFSNPKDDFDEIIKASNNILNVVLPSQEKNPKQYHEDINMINAIYDAKQPPKASPKKGK